MLRSFANIASETISSRKDNIMAYYLPNRDKQVQADLMLEVIELALESGEATFIPLECHSGFHSLPDASGFRRPNIFQGVEHLLKSFGAFISQSDNVIIFVPR